MLLNYCIGKAASGVKEFFILPVGDKLIQYDTIAVNTIVKNKVGGVSSCDVLFSDNLNEFNRDYLNTRPKLQTPVKIGIYRPIAW